MDRRELLKSGLLIAAGTAALGLTGCSNKQEINTTKEPPKQNGKFHISYPLPFNFDLIDQIADFNNVYKKSKVVNLFNNIPYPLSQDFNGFFACKRGYNDSIKSYDDFAKYVIYAKKKGFDFVYVLNSPKSFSKHDFEGISNLLYSQLDFLHDIGCKTLRIGNTQLATIINEYKYDFSLQASTTFEYHNTLQYINLFKNYPNINTIDIAIDENRNFHFLKSMKKLFPDKTIEILANEPCLIGCPARISHPSSDFCIFECGKIRDNIVDLCKTHVVYPWNLSYYQDIGINNFKLVSWPLRAQISTLYSLRNYLDCVESDIRLSNISFQFFVNQIFLRYSRMSEDIKLRDVLDLLPDIRYFIAHGDKCATQCGAECTYCDDCANKIKKLIS